MGGSTQNTSSTEYETDYEIEIDEPKYYQVVLLNDDYTTMEFVITVLMSIFHKDFEEATMIMLDVHNKGRGLVGSYTYDIAKTRVDQVHQLARQNEFPLKCVLEQV